METIRLQSSISQKQCSCYLGIKHLRRALKQDIFWRLLTFVENDLSALLLRYGTVLKSYYELLYRSVPAIPISIHSRFLNSTSPAMAGRKHSISKRHGG